MKKPSKLSCVAGALLVGAVSTKDMKAEAGEILNSVETIISQNDQNKCIRMPEIFRQEIANEINAILQEKAGNVNVGELSSMIAEARIAQNYIPLQQTISPTEPKSDKQKLILCAGLKTATLTETINHIKQYITNLFLDLNNSDVESAEDVAKVQVLELEENALLEEIMFYKEAFEKDKSSLVTKNYYITTLKTYIKFLEQNKNLNDDYIQIIEKINKKIDSLMEVNMSEKAQKTKESIQNGNF